MTRPIIVLAEDHADTCNLYLHLLDSVGYDVRVATTGDAALALVRQVRPAAVVLDIGLPGIDGIEICARIRQHGWFRNLPIIAVTGWLSAGHRLDHLARASFSELFGKPVDTRELLAAVQRWAPSTSSPSSMRARPAALGPAPTPWMGS
ncbi:MAG: response regulator [Acidobacteria bacterium]|nr:response regulator [Acidobacteriota bacterium]